MFDSIFNRSDDDWENEKYEPPYEEDPHDF